MQSFSFFSAFPKDIRNVLAFASTPQAELLFKTPGAENATKTLRGMVSSSSKCNAAILGHLQPGRAAARRWMQSDGPVEDADETKQIERYAFSGS
jgi:hypothetical protein